MFKIMSSQCLYSLLNMSFFSLANEGHNKSKSHKSKMVEQYQVSLTADPKPRHRRLSQAEPLFIFVSSDGNQALLHSILNHIDRLYLNCFCYNLCFTKQKKENKYNGLYLTSLVCILVTETQHTYNNKEKEIKKTRILIFFFQAFSTNLIIFKIFLKMAMTFKT